jgi:hypothetical protein
VLAGCCRGPHHEVAARVPEARPAGVGRRGGNNREWVAHMLPPRPPKPPPPRPPCRPPRRVAARTYAYGPTREAAIAAFAKSWRRL